MKLTLMRQQEIQTDRRGRSQGAIYQLACRLALDQHELELVDRYAQSDYPIVGITHDIVRDAQWRRPEDAVLRLSQLTEGWSVNTRFVSDARHAEAVIKEGCENFKGVLLMMEGYGGQEEVEF
jgi:hypothetical protein